MFTPDEFIAAAIRRAFDDGGELAGVVELRQRFPLLGDNSHAGRARDRRVDADCRSALSGGRSGPGAASRSSSRDL
jgi:hypothetical protein